MKKISIVLAVIATFTSCSESNKNIHHSNTQKGKGDNPASCIDSVLIPLESADVLIYNYHQYKTKVLKEPMGYSSFILNANALREYLNSNPDIVNLDVYLAKKDTCGMTDTSMSLVYIGGIDSAGYDVEKVYTKPGDQKQSYFMDQVMPCPVCEKRISAYTPPKGRP
jgi:hypothetical protein